MAMLVTSILLSLPMILRIAHLAATHWYCIWTKKYMRAAVFLTLLAEVLS